MYFGQLQISERYADLELMPMLIDRQSMLLGGDGFILKPKKKDTGFTVIATGDNYLFPQILEIKYR